MCLKVLGLFLIFLPTLFLWAVLIKEYGWKSVGKAIGVMLGAIACVAGGLYLISGG